VVPAAAWVGTVPTEVSALTAAAAGPLHVGRFLARSCGGSRDLPV